LFSIKVICIQFIPIKQEGLLVYTQKQTNKLWWLLWVAVL
jgi:hypothetical protein